jgi:hypothetical protein
MRLILDQNTINILAITYLEEIIKKDAVDIHVSAIEVFYWPTV